MCDIIKREKMDSEDIIVIIDSLTKFECCGIYTGVNDMPDNMLDKKLLLAKRADTIPLFDSSAHKRLTPLTRKLNYNLPYLTSLDSVGNTMARNFTIKSDSNAKKKKTNKRKLVQKSKIEIESNLNLI